MIVKSEFSMNVTFEFSMIAKSEFSMIVKSEFSMIVKSEFSMIVKSEFSMIVKSEFSIIVKSEFSKIVCEKKRPNRSHAQTNASDHQLRALLKGVKSDCKEPEPGQRATVWKSFAAKSSERRRSKSNNSLPTLGIFLEPRLTYCGRSYENPP